MFAIVDIAGVQLKVQKDKFVYAPLMAGDKDSTVEFSKVLLTNEDGTIEVGTPYVSGVTVKGKILDHVKGDKVLVFKKKRRKGYRKLNGHRQNYTKILIETISK
jgi:large subunit ribosomal protein L21